MTAFLAPGTYADSHGRLHIQVADLLARATAPDTPANRRQLARWALADLRAAGITRRVLVVVHLSRRGLA